MLKDIVSKKVGIILSTVFLTAPLLTSKTMAAEEIEPKRFSIEVGGGLNIIMPYFNTRFGYLLPTSNNNIEVFASYNRVSSLNPNNLGNMFTLGGKYYFRNKEMFRPFFKADVGVNKYALGDSQPFLFLAGFGSDVMFNDTLGLSFLLETGMGGNINGISISNGLGLSLRPELNFKIKF